MSFRTSEKVAYVCASCGYETPRWAGRCSQCGQWGTLEKTSAEKGAAGGVSLRKVAPAKLQKISSFRPGSGQKRVSLGMGEVDRVLGGGVVSGEVVLVAGEPGIGKSTLLLQTALSISKSKKLMYVSGEESLSQLHSRVERLKAGRRSSDLLVTDETNVESVIAAAVEELPDIVIVDSIQAVSSADVDSYTGSLAQVRECGQRLTQYAKETGTPVLIVGQVTKQGVIAGPKVLEHTVDAVVYFEGDEMGMYRILRCVKNRFGSTSEVGIFEMTSSGLSEVDDPSRVFHTEVAGEAGVALSAVYKGSRTLFIEVQALTSPAAFGAPRRLSTGFDKRRLEMLCAVLSRRAGISLAEEDVFVNILGGMKVDDPGVDLGVCMAIASAKKNKKVKGGVVCLGEVGLSGEVRSTPVRAKIAVEAKRRGLSIVGSTPRKALQLNVLVKSNFN